MAKRTKVSTTVATDASLQPRAASVMGLLGQAEQIGGQIETVTRTLAVEARGLLDALTTELRTVREQWAEDTADHQTQIDELAAACAQHETTIATERREHAQAVAELTRKGEQAADRAVTEAKAAAAKAAGEAKVLADRELREQGERHSREIAATVGRLEQTIATNQRTAEQALQDLGKQLAACVRERDSWRAKYEEAEGTLARARGVVSAPLRARPTLDGE